MARIVLNYREMRVIIITASRSATSQFTHNGRVYTQKLTNAKIQDRTDQAVVIKSLYENACKKIDEVLGPVRAEHLLKS